MRIEYKNLIVNVYHEPEDFNGASTLSMPMDYANRYVSENEGSEQANQIVNAIEEDEEHGNVSFTTMDTDLCVYIFYWMVYECPNDTFEFDYYVESPFWLFHDLSHAKHDVNGGVFYVDQYIEEQRIFDGLKLLKKADMMEEFKPQMFESIVKDFRNRWKHEIDTKRILKKMGWKKRDFFELLIEYHY